MFSVERIYKMGREICSRPHIPRNSVPIDVVDVDRRPGRRPATTFIYGCIRFIAELEISKMSIRGWIPRLIKDDYRKEEVTASALQNYVQILQPSYHPSAVTGSPRP